MPSTPNARRPRVRTAASALLAAALLASGCGSTVRSGLDPAAAGAGGAQVADGGFAVPGSSTGAGLGAPGSSGGLSVPGASTGGGTTGAAGGGTTGSGGVGSAGGVGAGGGGGGAGGGGTVGAGGGATGGSGGGGTAPPAPGASVGQATGRGFDETTVRIGYGNVPGAAGAIGALGIGGVSGLDPKQMAEIVVADINASGGIAGRQVELVVHDHDAQTSIFNPDQAAQIACAAWTQDTQVFAVTRPAMIAAEQITACLDAADTPVLIPGGLQGTQAFYQPFYDTYPDFYNIGAMEAGAYDRVAVRRLVERDFFEPWDTTVGGPASGPTAPEPKIAIVTIDNEHGDRTIESLSAELARYGLAFDEIIRSSGRIDQATTEASSQVLQFRSAGVTHIFGVDVAFQSAAESQGYRPRYFMSSALNLIASTSPAANLRGAMSESIAPASDTSPSSYPGSPTPAADRCLSVLAEGGIQPTETADIWLAQLVCDSFYPLRDAIAASGELSNEGLRRGFVALSGQPVTAATWTYGMTDSVRASGQAVRDMVYDEGCTCFVYTDGTNHSP